MNLRVDCAMRQLRFDWTVETGPIFDAFEFAKDFYRVYVKRGDTLEFSRSACMGFAQSDGPDLQTGGYFRGITLKPNQVAIELQDGSVFTFTLEHIYQAIQEE